MIRPLFNVGWPRPLWPNFLMPRRPFVRDHKYFAVRIRFERHVRLFRAVQRKPPSDAADDRPPLRTLERLTDECRHSLGTDEAGAGAVLRNEHGTSIHQL